MAGGSRSQAPGAVPGAPAGRVVMSKHGYAKCGYCHTCTNPQLKKACITNKHLKDAVPGKGGAKKTKGPSKPGSVDRDPLAAQEAALHGAVTSLAPPQPKPPPLPRPPFIADPNQRVRKWRKQWVHQDTIIGDGKCRVQIWVTEEPMKDILVRQVQPGAETP
eukprot:CAMPEP_0182876364 /NCGR_PEP_ID=MMETSP0034_2-20130328/14105_1 /TAXON_ID=156128 /ORGANISM="Nephroselmis pyriformis, Strain CCMP717" /LENGTH=161 /DNA_ID=CAMNT_0025009151 /DNA_START=114 /DNA_END=595 /DNA_ORIENTATION=+